MTDKEYCSSLTDFDDICCMDLDTWLSDCPKTASQFRLTKQKLTDQCNIPTRVEKLAVKCPVKYTVPDKEKDHEDCKKVVNSIQSIICSDIDKFIKNCPYHSFVKGLSKEYLESVTNNFECSSVDKVTYADITPEPLKSSFFNSTNIFILLFVLVIVIIVSIFLLK
jgi:hypothetical protein